MFLAHMFKSRKAILIFLLIQLFLATLMAVEGEEKDSPEFLEAVAAIEAKYAQYHRIELGEILMGDGNRDFEPSPHRDKHLLYYDAKNLYYCVVAQIDSSFTKGKESIRDKDSESDGFCLYLITQPEAFLVYVYIFTPLGNKMDYTIDHSFKNNYLWNSNYQYTSKYGENLWIIEASIPFNDLRYSGGPPYKFSVMLNRYHKDTNTSYWYPHVKSMVMGLDYFKKYHPILIEQRIQHDWMPQLRVHSTAIYDVKQERGNRLLDNMGLNFSLKPGKSSTAKFTLQPDFSDTPLDSESNIYNTKYPPMIAENRFFFTEDYDQLVSRSEFWYTRQIISPLAAVKYNYKQDKSSLAVLALKDKKFDDEPTSGDYWLASGFARSVGNQQGFLNAYLRASENGKNVNALASLNLGFRLWSSLVINPEFALSHDHNEANTSDKTATMGALKAKWQSDYWFVSAGMEYVEKDFTARMGLIDETDVIGGMIGASYNRFANKWYNTFNAQISTGALNTLSTKEFIAGNISFYSSATLFKYALMVGVNANYNEQVYRGICHSYFSQGCYAVYQKYRGFRPGLSLSFGETLIYSKNELANFFSVTPSFSSEINQNTTLGAQISYYIYDTPQTADFDNEFFFGDLNLKTQFVDKLSLTQGIRLNDNTVTLVPATDEDAAWLANGYLGYYANLNWTINKHLDVIAGFKSRERRYRNDDYRQIDVMDQNLYIKAEYQF